ncbi:hypothetical protein NB691_001799 [Xanthomonas sacchari]|nr:hypothetical protein [Xanthomonas sacchari]
MPWEPTAPVVAASKGVTAADAFDRQCGRGFSPDATTLDYTRTTQWARASANRRRPHHDLSRVTTAYPP